MYPPPTHVHLGVRRTRACVHGPEWGWRCSGPHTAGRLPVHSYLPEALCAHGHPLELSLVVGAVHPAEHHHAALLLVAEGGGTERARGEGRRVGGFSQAR